MFTILLTCLIVIAVIMVAVILLQKSDGTGMSGTQAASMFGGALTGSSAGNFFTKLTSWLATIFFAICLALAYIVSHQGAGVNGTSEVRKELVKGAPVEQAAPVPADEALKLPETAGPEVPAEPVKE